MIFVHLVVILAVLCPIMDGFARTESVWVGAILVSKLVIFMSSQIELVNLHQNAKK